MVSSFLHIYLHIFWESFFCFLSASMSLLLNHLWVKGKKIKFWKISLQDVNETPFYIYSTHSSMNLDKEGCIEVRRGKKKKVKASFIFKGLLGCFLDASLLPRRGNGIEVMLACTSYGWAHYIYFYLLKLLRSRYL